MTVLELIESLREMPPQLRAENPAGREIHAVMIINYGDRNPYVLVE
jgi:hypothetical protein